MITETVQRHGMILKDHTFEVPLDYKQPQGRTITVFGREVVDVDRDQSDNTPWLIYFQGGPGFPSPRPTGKSGWIGEALKNYRIFFLDQRGTGLSSPVTTQSMSVFQTPEEQAEYLTHFRADNIINDAEFIRRQFNIEKWSLLGQSYGGFCIMRYLSVAPGAIREAFITGGVPSLTRHIDDVYRETHKFCQNKSRQYFSIYPDDLPKVNKIVHHLRAHEVYLPCGERLTWRRFQNIGMNLGFASGIDGIHQLLEGAFTETPSGEQLSFSFLRRVENYFSFNTNPIFAILHESIYAQEFATLWSAEKMRHEYPQFDDCESGEFLFTGEMIGPWMFDEYQQLQPLKEAAKILAEKADWPQLYDTDILTANTVPVACAVYFNDMFVNQQFSLETINSVPGMKAWVTSEYEHCGLGVDGARVFSRLRDMARDRIDR